MHRRYQFLATAFFMVALAQSAWATMIVVVYTKDGYWIGADSYRTGAEKVSLVCKIHETRFGLLIKSGSSQGETTSGEVYSTDMELKRLLVESDNIASFKSRLTSQFKYDIDEELALLVDHPYVNALNLESIDMDWAMPNDKQIKSLGRGILLFDTNSANATGEALIVEPQSSSHFSSYFKRVYKYEASFVSNWSSIQQMHLAPNAPVHFPSSVRQFIFWISFDRSDAWVQEHPKQAIEEMLESAHLKEPEHIGPPYSIVHVALKNSNTPKIEWVVKGMCPGWSESLNLESTLTQRRDELRNEKATQGRPILRQQSPSEWRP